MGKSFLKIFMLLFLFAALAFCFTACKTPHEHDYTVVVSAPTCTEQGYTTYTCDCGEHYVDTYVNALGHEYTDYVFNNDATCTQNGTETAKCNHTDCKETHTRTKENSMLGHSYGVPTYTWNGGKCTATRICAHDSNHKETETATAKYVKTPTPLVLRRKKDITWQRLKIVLLQCK